MKSTILLATALFLITAPAPDSGDIAELTSNFIVPAELPGLNAAETSTLRGTVVVKQKDSKHINAQLALNSKSNILPGKS